jgi:Fe-S-cluster containining protein
MMQAVVELDESSHQSLREAVRDASGRADVRLAVGAIYEHLQDAIDLRKPICNTSGRCCRFDEYGHRLFVTTMELATFVSDLPAPIKSPATPSREQTAPPISKTQSACPFQIQNLCTAHKIRPFGCRVFFCDPTATDWQTQQYERLHGHLKRLHDELNVPYFYVEWRQALAALGILTAFELQSPRNLLSQPAVLL